MTERVISTPTTRKPIGANVPGSRKTCLVTGSSVFSAKLAEWFADPPLEVTPRLSDLIAPSDCARFIVDTRVRDMDLWPAPLSADAESVHKRWVFLISDLADATKLSNLPNDCRIFERHAKSIPDIIAFLDRGLDANAMTEIARVRYVAQNRTFVIRMSSGITYLLEASLIPAIDDSDIARTRLSSDHHYFTVTQSSGNKVEIPWDTVLHHCEPEYEHYKGKTDLANDVERARRIGGRVRGVRMEQGLSIAELSRRSGLLRPNLSRLEHGKHEPSLETLERIANGLDVPLFRLVAG